MPPLTDAGVTGVGSANLAAINTALNTSAIGSTTRLLVLRDGALQAFGPTRVVLAGLAALALDEVFQSAEVISKINFTVTGSFDKPVVTEVNRHSTEVPVPVRIAQPEIRNDDSRQPLLN